MSPPLPAPAPASAGCRSRTEGPGDPKAPVPSSEPNSVAAPAPPPPGRSSKANCELNPCSTTSVVYLSCPDWSCHLRVCSEPSRYTFDPFFKYCSATRHSPSLKMTTRCHSVRSRRSPVVLSRQVSLVATLSWTMGRPSCVRLISGSRPRLPTNMTLFTEPAMTVSVSSHRNRTARPSKLIPPFPQRANRRDLFSFCSSRLFRTQQAKFPLWRLITAMHRWPPNQVARRHYPAEWPRRVQVSPSHAPRQNCSSAHCGGDAVDRAPPTPQTERRLT